MYVLINVFLIEQNKRNKQNKDTISEYQREYQREYYVNNKEKISNKCKERNLCQCGSYYDYSGKPQHLKTKKHLNFINNI